MLYVSYNSIKQENLKIVKITLCFLFKLQVHYIVLIKNSN